MELPKNVTQIGEVGKTCKIYVEDYVVSYMKQLNQTARDKDMAVALYGKRREENGIVYYFLYGAGKLDLLSREVRHLSQAQHQEIERIRKKYFQELTFVGYRLLDGEMIEGFHICEQDICRYISGYAQFYEKNDAMLAYMLDVREQAQPEQFDQVKYEEVKRRQEERRVVAENQTRSTKVSDLSARNSHNTEGYPKRTTMIRHMPASANLQKMRMTAVGVFALLCLLGVTTLRQSEEEESANAEAFEAVAASANVQTDKLVMEDKLDQVLLEENQTAEKNVDMQETAQKEKQDPTQHNGKEEKPGSAQQPEKEEKPSSAQQPETPETLSVNEKPTSGNAVTPEPETTKVSQTTGAVAYVIQPGDTLTAISKRQYGTDIRVADICNLNKISNPDDIKEGQVIMLPR